jgi:FKBP-type peptidyl-prolyl cis-trans isomerase (trigger factor)
MFKKAARSLPDNGKTRVSDSAPCEKTLQVTLGPDAVEPIRTEVVAEFQKAAALPGFRKGKVPAEMVRQQYAKSIEDETLHRATRRALEEAAKEHDLKPVGPFEVSQAAFTGGGGLTLAAKVEVEPVFPLGAYKGIPLTRGSADVSAADVDKALTKLQESMAQLVPAKEGGEQKERQVPALDDELAKDLGYESLPKLRAHVEAKLREQQRAAQDEALEGALCTELLARHPFQVPAKLVGHQADRLTREFKARLLLSGMAEAQVGVEIAKFTEQLRTSAERRVKLSFILDRVADEEKVGVTQDELVKRLWELSRRWKKDPAEVRKMFDAEGLWPSVVSSIRHEKTIAVLLAAAAITGAAPSQQSQPVPTPSSKQGGKHA